MAHILLYRFWIPAFAGMTGGSHLTWIVIPAKAGIQMLLSELIEKLQNNYLNYRNNIS